MSSFWNTSDGEDASQTGTEFDAGGGNLEPIPAGAQCLAAIDEAKWDKDGDGNRFVSLRWMVLAPEEFKNRKVYQKLWVDDLEPRRMKEKGIEDATKKRDKDKRMLGVIDTNAGGRLGRSPTMPTDETLTGSLTMKPMVIRVELWEQRNRMTGDVARGNWIGAVSPRVSPSDLPPPPKAAPAPQRGGGAVMNDEIPFAPQFF
jgi:hypothetical protein